MSDVAGPDAFFLETPAGRRFCLHYPTQAEARACVVYLHPFAEEMNKSRRMAAMTARRMAQAGVAVLQIDLHGCGDSAGDFSDASWASWLVDVGHTVAWMRNHYGQSPILWGCRLGGLLAAAYAASDAACQRLLLWSPVLNGEQFLVQFLRLKVANQMLAGGEGLTTQQLQQSLQAGASVEIAGYELASSLALPMAACKLTTLLRPGQRVDWFEMQASADRPLPGVIDKLVAERRAAGVEIALQSVTGEPFWSTQEITDVPALVEATLAVQEERRALV